MIELNCSNICISAEMIFIGSWFVTHLNFTLWWLVIINTGLPVSSKDKALILCFFPGIKCFLNHERTISTPWNLNKKSAYNNLHFVIKLILKHYFWQSSSNSIFTGCSSIEGSKISSSSLKSHSKVDEEERLLCAPPFKLPC